MMKLGQVIEIGSFGVKLCLINKIKFDDGTTILVEVFSSILLVDDGRNIPMYSYLSGIGQNVCENIDFWLMEQS